MPYKIISTGNMIVADESFVEAHYPNDYVIIPEPEALATPKDPISVLAFRSRFTDAEKVAIYTAARQAVEVQIWLDDLMAASEVLTDDPRTMGGVQALEAAGMIGAGRAAEILA